MRPPLRFGIAGMPWQSWGTVAFCAWFAVIDFGEGGWMRWVGAPIMLALLVLNVGMGCRWWRARVRLLAATTSAQRSRTDFLIKAVRRGVPIEAALRIADLFDEHRIDEARSLLAEHYRTRIERMRRRSILN